MIFYLLGMVILVLYNAKIYSTKEYSANYLSRTTTDSVKGIFLLFILASHARQYVAFDSVYDQTYVLLARFLDQTIVCAFLFYSGYGIYESIKRSGNSYIRKMPVRRILPTLINFDIAVLLYLLVSTCLGKRYAMRTILLSFTGWKSVGNSNWYIFAILVCYVLTWLAFLIMKDNHKPALILVAAGLLGYTIVVYMRKPSEGWWYNTIFCYLLGMLYSAHKDPIEKKIFAAGQNKVYAALGAVLAAAVLACRPLRGSLVIYEIWSLAFAMLIILLTAKIDMHSRTLQWLGKHTFEVYILQRLPMMVLHHFGINQYPYLFFVISLLTIYPMISCFSKVTKAVSNGCRKIAAG